MGLAEVQAVHTFCSKSDIGPDPEITFGPYYETRWEGGANDEGKTGRGSQGLGNREHQQESDWPL